MQAGAAAASGAAADVVAAAGVDKVSGGRAARPAGLTHFAASSRSRPLSPAKAIDLLDEAGATPTRHGYAHRRGRLRRQPASDTPVDAALDAAVPASTAAHAPPPTRYRHCAHLCRQPASATIAAAPASAAAPACAANPPSPRLRPLRPPPPRQPPLLVVL